MGGHQCYISRNLHLSERLQLAVILWFWPCFCFISNNINEVLSSQTSLVITKTIKSSRQWHVSGLKLLLDEMLLAICAFFVLNMKHEFKLQNCSCMKFKQLTLWVERRICVAQVRCRRHKLMLNTIRCFSPYINLWQELCGYCLFFSQVKFNDFKMRVRK